MQWPENLGTGRPHDPDHSWEHYKLGLCYKALGKAELAREQFTETLQGRAPKNSSLRAKAKKELAALENRGPSDKARE